VAGFPFLVIIDPLHFLSRLIYDFFVNKVVVRDAGYCYCCLKQISTLSTRQSNDRAHSSCHPPYFGGQCSAFFSSSGFQVLVN